jgi:hypothetical protein
MKSGEHGKRKSSTCAESHTENEGAKRVCQEDELNVEVLLADGRTIKFGQALDSTVHDVKLRVGIDEGIVWGDQVLYLMDSVREEELENRESLSHLCLEKQQAVRMQLVCDDAPDLSIEGTKNSKARHHAMGVFTAVIGELHNERPVWQSLDNEDRLYYDSKAKRWCVGALGMYSSSDQTGWNFAYLYSSSETDAMRPYMMQDTVWMVARAPARGPPWGQPATFKAAGVVVRKCTALEKLAAEQSIQDSNTEALAQAATSCCLIVDGMYESEQSHQFMGTYDFIEGELHKGRGMWRKRGDPREKLLYFDWKHMGSPGNSECGIGLSVRECSWMLRCADTCSWHKSYHKDNEYGDELSRKILQPIDTDAVVEPLNEHAGYAMDPLDSAAAAAFPTVDSWSLEKFSEGEFYPVGPVPEVHVRLAAAE